MYSGRGVILNKEPHNLLRLSLSKNISFEASPVISIGEQEVHEIYRAYYLFHATFLSLPRCISFQQSSTKDANGNDITKVQFKYLLHQCFFGWFEDRALLVIHANVRSKKLQKGNRQQEVISMEINRLEERWNGAPSWNNAWIWISRRINGILSWYFTSIFVPDP